MRVREWYSWHFPELQKIVNDNYIFSKLAVFIKNKADLNASALPQLEEICGDSIKAQQVLDASRMSMGTDISPIDMINIESFATRVVSLTEYRKKLHNYLLDKMNLCAPNLSALIGEQVGARLISHAGSLTNLAKYPASTVQILGAEKALFRSVQQTIRIASNHNSPLVCSILPPSRPPFFPLSRFPVASLYLVCKAIIHTLPL
jgi:nucleolar protein 56